MSIGPQMNAGEGGSGSADYDYEHDYEHEKVDHHIIMSLRRTPSNQRLVPNYETPKRESLRPRLHPLVVLVISIVTAPPVPHLVWRPLGENTWLRSYGVCVAASLAVVGWVVSLTAYWRGREPASAERMLVSVAMAISILSALFYALLFLFMFGSGSR